MATAGGISMVQCYMFSLDDAQMPQEQTYRHAAATHDSYRYVKDKAESHKIWSNQKSNHA